MWPRRCVLAGSISLIVQGSGKTLAYGLPILQHVLETLGRNDGPAAMILAPTRELAMQVRTHLMAVVRAACEPDEVRFTCDKLG